MLSSSRLAWMTARPLVVQLLLALATALLTRCHEESLKCYRIGETCTLASRAFPTVSPCGDECRVSVA